MNRVILKNSIKEIKSSFRRFVSLLLIAMLGVGFFVGVKATTPDMKKTIDTYFDNEKLFDIKVLSTLGLTDEDINAIKEIDGISGVYGTYSEDVFVNINDADNVVKVIEVTDDINNIKLTEGRMPNNETECVIENQMSIRGNLKVGEKIQIEEDLDEEEDSSFKETSLEIVGIVNSPLYISQDKGSSRLGTGKLDYYIYVPKENIVEDIYTEIYAKVSGAKEMDTTSDEYSDYIENIINKVEDIKEVRENARYDSLISEATDKLNEAQDELDDKRSDGEKEIADAEKEILDGEKKLKDSEQELADARATADSEFSKATETLTKAGDALVSGEVEYNTKKAEAEQAFKEAEDKKEELNLNLDKVMFGLEEINTQYNIVLMTLNSGVLPPDKKAELEITKRALKTKKAELEATGKQITAGIKEIDSQIEKGKTELNNAYNQILNGYNELNNGWAELNSKKAKADSEFSDAERKIADARKELVDGKKELADAKEEFNEKIQEAEEKLYDARQKIDDIENPKWYIFDRSSNNGYDSFISDTENIKRLGQVFPILFFVIAILISLTSMSRMVEEQRIELGTMKALGYSNASICIKYVIYALVATVIGSIIGMLIGFNVIPTVIISMYQMMYPSVNDAIIEFNTYYAIIGTLIMAVCTIGATLYSCQKELNYAPSMLMRPKPPKNGKRVFLENIHFIWNHLSFNDKVTIRNMFRYKKRFLMTIIGIMGCTALLLLGFALKDSISNLMNLQYENVYDYDSLLTLNSSLVESEIDNIVEELLKKNEIKNIAKTCIISNEISKKNEDKEVDVQVVVPEDEEEFSKLVHLNNIETRKNETLKDDEILITEKVCELINVKVGDKIVLTDNDGNEFEAKIGAIVENYIYHYVFMNENLYEKLYGETYETNVLYLQTIELTEKEEDVLNKEILKNSKVASLTSISYLKANLAQTIGALDKVVYVLIVSSGLLAFVVLYNLANVNISERKRELATIKVLGFYDNEVYDYITKEIVLLAILGIIIGLFAGYGLTGFILKTCETEPLVFRPTVSNMSYVYSAGISALFTVIVNIMTYFVLKKVDMIESLKSVE